MATIKIDNAKCLKEKEKICVEICPFSVFREGNTKRVEIVKVENCIMCRTCVVNCPGQAIDILV
ncbi:MAG TPA: 4Fe-4S dicluster domain-containing protein [Candidatus Acidoferrales bacterium]|nr:4Fe-4S dicluster domain-containing protein [Candidatus Acidoferrales bacterium]